MSALRTCAKCGKEVDSSVLANFCLQCVLDSALSDESELETNPTEPRAPFGAGSGGAPGETLGRFGDYELLEEIARGGMGVVYKARQLSLGRIVAVKMVLSGRFASRSVAERFKAEAIATAVLRHPQIVAVHDVGLYSGQPFFSMEFVEGQNLAQLVGSRPLAARKAARYVKLLAEAVDYAHSQGILHRDLKPSNVIVDAATDQPRLTDFGLAKRLDSDSSLTVTGQVLGSPNFMPPEQASPGHGKVGRPSDVYGLGAILYHLLTARAPFQAESLPALVTEVVSTEPVPPRLLNPAVPRDLETICLKCLEKEQNRRYATAKDLAEDLDRFLADEPVHARPIGRTDRLWRWCRRKPALATLSSTVLALLLIVLFGAPVALVRIHRARLEAEQNLYAADMRLASEAFRDGANGQAQELLQAHEPRKGAQDLRGFEWRYLRHAADQSGLVTHQFKGLPALLRFDNPSLDGVGNTLYNLQRETSQFLAWDMATWTQLPLKVPDHPASDRWWFHPSRQAALDVSDKEHTVAFYRLPNFEVGPVIEVPGQASQATISKDLGTLALAFQDGAVQRIQVWDLVTNAQRWILGEYPGKVDVLRFSPDGSVLLATDDNGQIRLWSIAEGKALPAPPLTPAGAEKDLLGPPFFGPGSTRLFFKRGRAQQALMVWDWTTERLSIAHPKSAGELLAFAFSPDGASLAIADAGKGIVLLDAKESRHLGVMPINGRMIASLAFSPDGVLLASASRDHTARLWDVKTQRELQTLGGNDGQANEVVFSADGKSLITQLGNGEIKVWDLAAALGQGVLWRTTNSLNDLIVSADESVLATHNNQGEIQVWDRMSGREIRRIQTGETELFASAFSPTEHIVAWAGAKWLGIFDYSTATVSTFPISRIFGFYAPAFSPDGRELAFADSTNIMILDMATRKMRALATIQNAVVALDISPDGSLLASAHAGGAIILWDRARGLQITNIIAHPPFAFDVHFSRDGRLLVSGGADGTGKLWELTRGRLKLRHILRGHLGWLGVDFSPDGQRVVSSTSDSTLKLWDTRTGLEVGSLYGHDGGIGGYAFSRDGNTIYSGGEGGEVHIWRAPPLDQLDSARSEKAHGNSESGPGSNWR